MTDRVMPSYREYQNAKLSTPLPCPFCGWDKPTIFEESEVDGVLAAAFVQCLECGANLAHGDYEPRSEAIAAWNRRTGVTEINTIGGLFRDVHRVTLELMCATEPPTQRDAIQAALGQISEGEAVIQGQRPIVREASMMRSEFDRHLRKECSCAPNECAGNLFAFARKVWPRRPPAIFKNTGRG